MSALVILVCGVQGSGKSWVCRQLAWKFRYIAHDRCWSHPFAAPGEGNDVAWGPPGSKSTHLHILIEESAKRGHTIITECPFGERELRDNLVRAGIQVVPVFVVEEADILAKRYRLREGKEIPVGAVTRASNLTKRAIDWGNFVGGSEAVLKHLKALKV